MKFVSVFELLVLFTITLSAQTSQEIDLGNENRFLLGPITQHDLTQGIYSPWYEANYAKYQPELKRVDEFKNSLSEYHILVFMGTWCSDSKREIPRFIKILENASFPMEKLKIIALDKRKENYKKSPSGEEWGLQITRVPTFIFLKNGREINRIVESPVSSLEEDILAIVLQKPYRPHYSHLKGVKK